MEKKVADNRSLSVSQDMLFDATQRIEHNQYLDNLYGSGIVVSNITSPAYGNDDQITKPEKWCAKIYRGEKHLPRKRFFVFLHS